MSTRLPPKLKNGSQKILRSDYHPLSTCLPSTGQKKYSIFLRKKVHCLPVYLPNWRRALKKFSDLTIIHCLPVYRLPGKKSVPFFWEKRSIVYLSTRLPVKMSEANCEFLRSDKNPLSTLSTRLPPKICVQFSEKKSIVYLVYPSTAQKMCSVFWEKIHCLPCLPVYHPKNVFRFLRKKSSWRNYLEALSTCLPVYQ